MIEIIENITLTATIFVLVMIIAPVLATEAPDWFRFPIVITGLISFPFAIIGSITMIWIK